MSETSTLISCTGKITRAELAHLPTPPATETHIPIPHSAVVETLVETLSHRHIGVVGEEFAVSSDAMEMFGVLDLEAGFEGCRFAIGIRNANNKRFRLACTVGLRVFVCHNLAGGLHRPPGANLVKSYIQVITATGIKLSQTALHSLPTFCRDCFRPRRT
jgi:hypothetical protein